jgi:alginate O-acetyltransferase complex protein AlgJ
MNGYLALPRATTALFLTALALPGALHLVTRDDASSVYREKRLPAPRPRLEGDPTTWSALPRALERYYDDFVRGRASLVRTQRVLRWELFGLTPVDSQTIRGVDDAIFFVGNDALEQHRGRRPWSEEQLAQACRVFAARRAALASRGIPYLFVVAPDKMSIFPELLPTWALPLAERTPLDQLLEALAAHGLADVVLDLRPVFQVAKGGPYPLYHHRGTHWTSYGSYLAYRAIAERLRGAAWPPTGRGAEVLELAPEALSLTTTTSDSWGEQWLLEEELVHATTRIELPELEESMLARSWWPQMVGQRATPDHLYRTQRREGSCALVFHDSFWDELRPFFTNHFATTAACATYGYDPRLVDALGPQLVVQICVERNLWQPVQPQIQYDSRNAWLDDAELAGAYRSPIWDEVRLVCAEDGELLLEGLRVGSFRAQRRGQGVFSGSSPLLGALELALFREGGCRHLVLRPLGLPQTYSFLAVADGARPLAGASAWEGDYEGDGFRYRVMALGDHLWCFEASGSVTHVIRPRDAEEWTCIDPRQPDLEWRFAREGASGARLELRVIAEGERSATLRRK